MESSVIYGIVHAIFPHIDSAFRIPKNRYGLLLYRIEVQHYQNILANLIFQEDLQFYSNHFRFPCLRQPRLKDMRLSQRSLKCLAVLFRNGSVIASGTFGGYCEVSSSLHLSSL